MDHASVGVRAAACQCTRSLSRSVRNLRTSLVDAGIVTPLLKVRRVDCYMTRHSFYPILPSMFKLRLRRRCAILYWTFRQ
jgi:hypothetical protein